MMAISDIEALYRGILTSWNNGNAGAFGDAFTEDASMVGFDGSPVESRRSITEHLRGIFADDQPARFVAKVREVRQLGPGVMLLRSVVGMLPPGQTDIEPEVNSLQVMVAVESDGTWRAAHLQTTPAAFHRQPEAVEALTTELRAVLAADGDSDS